jgi:hypothetical protein
MKEAILKGTKEAVDLDSKEFRVGSNLERGGKNIGSAKIVNLDEEEDIDDLMIDDDNQIGEPDEHLTIAD